MEVTLKDYKTSEKSWWCPGCGDFGVLAAMQKALVNLNIAPHEVAIVAGIGCSGKIGNYINSYNIHVVHGRTLPSALGVKMANRDLLVIAAGGDGDGFAIGMNHFIHAVRRNINVKYIVMDNHIYGLTKGQNSPTSDAGQRVKATPHGNVESPVRPLSLALSAGATFVAQGFSSNQAQLARLIEDAIRHPGFAFVNTLSPCVTYNKINTYDFYKQTLTNLDEDPDYRPDNRGAAIAKVLEKEELVTGLIYRDPSSVPYESAMPGFGKAPLAGRDIALAASDFEELLEHYR
ncbi:MAG: 2-oxoacid:ferredoxin oxidoreductase subunit beta [Thermaerobacter sp.]|nr:2-oxoacid:ferredoxin oxidoreductase subunit beta [Thermaerobacter sp.]